MKVGFPESVKKIFSIMAENGYECFLVGGCIRDIILGKHPKDWDFTTNAQPEQIIDVFTNKGYEVIPTGIKHGTVSVLISDELYEITTYRIDGKYSDGRHPDIVKFTNSITKDLQRRDFTINSIAFNPQIGFVDPFGGRDDINNKVIRTTGKAIDRFTEDALRMLRAIRFASVLNFSVEDETIEGIKKLAPSIEKISKERIISEFGKILTNNSMVGISLLLNTGLLKHIIPQVGNVELNFFRTSPADKDIRLAGMLYDAKDNAFNILKSLKYDNETIDSVTTILKYADYNINSKTYLKKIIGKIGKDKAIKLFEFRIAMAEAKNNIAAANENRDHIEYIKEVFAKNIPVSIKQLNINGDELKKMGIPEGRKIGKILNYLMERVLENEELNNRETLIQIIEKEQLI